MPNVVCFKFDQIPEQFHKKTRVKVASGPDRGMVYVLTGRKAVIGRGETADILLRDLKISRNHAELYSVERGWMVKDIGSVNGAFLNGEKFSDQRIYSGDIISMGETELEFIGEDAGTLLLKAPPISIDKIREKKFQRKIQKSKIQQSLKVGYTSKNSLSPQLDLADPVVKKKILMGIALIAFFYLVLSDSGSSSKNETKGKEARDVSKKEVFPYLQTESTNLEAQKFFQMGMREYREQNFLRAKSFFDLALQIDSGYQLARHYFLDSQNEMDKLVKDYLERGKKAELSLKLTEAEAQYEAVLRLLDRDKENQNYQRAKEMLENLKNNKRDRGISGQ